MTEPIDERSYDAGYLNGESSGYADWCAALDEVLPEEVDCHNPGAVARFVELLWMASSVAAQTFAICEYRYERGLPVKDALHEMKPWPFGAPTTEVIKFKGFTEEKQSE
jgi:hypothetical protein